MSFLVLKNISVFFYTLYIEGEGRGAAGEGEAIVRVHVTDSNDNRPKFESDGGELVVAVYTTTEYGHLVTKIQVKYEMVVEGKKGFLVNNFHCV